MSARIIVQDLRKRYGSVEALRGVNFEVAAGEVFGLLGPNGAGKTTTLECLSGLRQADTGRIEIAGVDPRSDPRAARARTGVVLSELSLPDQVTAREALRLFAAMHGDRRKPEALLERFGLAEQARAQVRALSQGQKQRLNLALAFLGEPEVMLLDEPSTGLDPRARRDLQLEVRRMRDDGRAIILATHLLDEAEQLCDRVAIIVRGQFVAQGTPAELARHSGRRQRVRLETDRPVSSGRWREACELCDVAEDGTVLSFGTSSAAQALAKILPALAAEGLEVRSLDVRPATLEEAFLQLTGEGRDR